jgi:hypothetical protein
MAKKNDTIEHPVTGEKITFIETSEETGGEYARAELRVRPHGFVAAPHIHPFAQESFEIRSGTFALVLDGAERRFRRESGQPCPPARHTRGGTPVRTKAWPSSSSVLH